MTNASIMFTAFMISIVSAAIVFVAGLMSGLVRMTTLLTRTFFAVMMSGAASYLILMVFDWYYERTQKKSSAEEVDSQAEQPKPAEVNIKAEGAEAAQSAPAGFKPLNAKELPKA